MNERIHPIDRETAFAAHADPAENQPLGQARGTTFEGD